jgi:hypothetical protein
VAKINGPGLAAVFAADADLQVRTGLAAFGYKFPWYITQVI